MFIPAPGQQPPQITIKMERPQAMSYADEERLPVIQELPDPFRMDDGKRVVTGEDWAKRREQIKAMLLFYEYGHLPSPCAVRVQSSSSFINNRGARQERVMLCCGPHDEVTFSLDFLIPQGKPGPFPILLTGDAGTTPIPAEVVARGYILAQFDRTKIAPDDASHDKGVYALYPDSDAGALAAWAWGYHRVVDYLLTRPDVDSKRIAIAGHSRGGKAVLLAGALDERVALTIANQSGTGGASPFRLQSKNSESLEKITARFGYWFHPRLRTFAGREDQLPFDQHFLMALVAPRALLLNSALQDPYANPHSTQQTFLAAQQVFKFLGASDKIGSHIRDGGHAFNESDWHALLDFADQQFFQRPAITNFAGMTAGDAAAFSWRAPHPQ